MFFRIPMTTIRTNKINITRRLNEQRVQDRNEETAKRNRFHDAIDNDDSARNLRVLVPGRDYREG